MTTSIWIIDDESIFTEGLKRILDIENAEITQFNNPLDLLNALQTADNKVPSLVITDINMPSISGLELTKSILKIDASIKIMALTGLSSSIIKANMLQAGVVAFISKSESIEKLNEAVNQVLTQGFYYSPDLLNLLHNFVVKKTDTQNKNLTKREQEILKLICLERKTSDIASKLFISERTVDGHRQNLLLKTESSNAIGLLIYALQVGLVDLEFIELNRASINN
jgi:DNA-binding NarL/FixJ family response regulator